MGRPALRLATAFLFVLAAAAIAGAETRDPFEAMQVLRPASSVPTPSVVFQALDGRPARLGEFLGQPVVLTFFTTW